jgi:hypothetical protein
LLTVHFPAVAYFHHENNEDLVVKFIENPIVPHANTIGILRPGEFL